MMIRRLLTVIALSLLAILALASSASAQEGPEVTDDEVNAISSELYCPICENVPLDVCPTQACADWRAEVRELLVAGSSEDEVKEYFVERYGVRVLGEPPRTGFTALVWILPVVGLAAGTLVLGRTLFQMRRAGTATPTSQSASQADAASSADNQYAVYVARLERELREFSQ